MALATLSNPVPGMLSNPVLAFVLRAALGAYVVYMARGFYADPLSYFRRWMPSMTERPWMKPLIRSGAAFCVWGGCFIVATAIATQILGLHGLALAVALIVVAAVSAYFVLPEVGEKADPGSPDATHRRWQK